MKNQYIFALAMLPYFINAMSGSVLSKITHNPAVSSCVALSHIANLSTDAMNHKTAKSFVSVSRQPLVKHSFSSHLLEPKQTQLSRLDNRVRLQTKRFYHTDSSSEQEYKKHIQKIQDIRNGYVYNGSVRGMEILGAFSSCIGIAGGVGYLISHPLDPSFTYPQLLMETALMAPIMVSPALLPLGVCSKISAFRALNHAEKARLLKPTEPKLDQIEGEILVDRSYCDLSLIVGVALNVIRQYLVLKYGL